MNTFTTAQKSIISAIANVFEDMLFDVVGTDEYSNIVNKIRETKATDFPKVVSLAKELKSTATQEQFSRFAAIAIANEFSKSSILGDNLIDLIDNA